MSNGSGVTEGLYRVRRRNQNAGPFASPRVVSNPPERVDRARGKWIFPRRPPRGPRERALTALVPTTLRFPVVRSPSPGPEPLVLPRSRRVRQRPRLDVPLRIADEAVAPEGRVPAQVAVRGGAAPVHRRQAALLGGQHRLQPAERQPGEPQQHLQHDGKRKHARRRRLRRGRRRPLECGEAGHAPECVSERPRALARRLEQRRGKPGARLGREPSELYVELREHDQRGRRREPRAAAA